MIRFGTDGWRAIIADEFTFENLRYVALATARYLKTLAPSRPSAVIGYDTRFLSREFAREVARVFASEGINVYFSFHYTTTPQVSYTTRQKRATIGVIITASHNPAMYNGYKVKASFGGPAPPEEIAKIEAELQKILKKPPKRWKLPDFDFFIGEGKIQLFNTREAYFRHLRRKINFELIKSANLKVAYDPMYGAGVNQLKTILPDAIVIHNELNPGFNELRSPEPIEANLHQLIRVVRENDCDVGFATDGDADRIGAIDDDGNYVTPHQLFLLLLKYLYQVRRKRGIVVKTVSLTSMVDLFCQKHKIRMIETPVGFKHIAKIMAKQRVLLGGEESGGFATSFHIPERDGIFCGLLLLELLAYWKKPLKQLCRELDHEFGQHRFLRQDVHVTEEQKKDILKFFRKKPKTIGEFPVVEISTLDGYKFFFENGEWLLVRASGTEPLIRFYAEARTKGKAHQIIEGALKELQLSS